MLRLNKIQKRFGTNEVPQFPQFPLPDYLAVSINNLIKAIKNNELGMIELWEEQVRADARGLSDSREEMWVIDYYTYRGWLKDVTD